MSLPPHLTTGPAGGPPVGPGRVYSTWNWDTCDFTYYYDPNGPSDAGGWLARPPLARTKSWSSYGDPIENLLTELPPVAVPIGRGRQAWGEIAVRNRADALSVKNMNLGSGQRGYHPLMDSGLGETSVDLVDRKSLVVPVIVWGGVMLASIFVVTKLVR